MIRSILLAVILISIFTGCANKIYQKTPLNKDNTLSYSQKSRYGEPKILYSYKLFGVYKNNTENLNKLQDILKQFYMKYSKVENTFRVKKRNLTEDEKFQRCNREVSYGLYGLYRNSIEKDSLIVRCTHLKNTSQKYFANGQKYTVHLYSPNYLNIEIKIGTVEDAIEIWQKVQIKIIDNRIFFFMTMNDVLMQKTLKGPRFLSEMVKMIEDHNLISENPIMTDVNEFLF